MVHEADGHTALDEEGIEVGEVRQAGQAQHHHVELLGARSRPGSSGQGPPHPVQGVLGIEHQPGHEGQHAQGGHAATGFELVHGVAEQEGIAAEHVDDEGSDAPAELLGQHGHRAVEMGEDATPVDVADHDRRDAGAGGQAQVHDVVVEQVDLGRAPGTLADHHVEPAAQIGQGAVDDLDQVGLGPLVVRRLPGLERAAHDDDLRRALAGRLEQDGVHGRLGLDPGRHRLDPLGPADLGTLGGHHRVQRHVLPLEGGDRHPLAGQEPAQAGDHGRLAGVRGRPAHHQGATTWARRGP